VTSAEQQGHTSKTGGIKFGMPSEMPDFATVYGVTFAYKLYRECPPQKIIAAGTKEWL